MSLSVIVQNISRCSTPQFSKEPRSLLLSSLAMFADGFNLYSNIIMVLLSFRTHLHKQPALRVYLVLFLCISVLMRSYKGDYRIKRYKSFQRGFFHAFQQFRRINELLNSAKDQFV